MDLFPNEAALKDSGYLFRIVDNGGETYDRITILFCDGDALLCSSGSICAHVESDQGLQRDADAVEAGAARDLRWIDLDPGLRKRIIADLNMGFADWLEAAPAAPSRDEARDWQGMWREYGDNREAIYRKGDSFYIRDDENEDSGPFETFRDAVFYMLPQDYDLSGPEYHTTVDLWDETGGPAPEWDRWTDPPVIDEDSEFARAVICYDPGNLQPGDQLERVAWFANKTDAENYLGNSESIDQDALHEGRYTIDDLDDPDAE